METPPTPETPELASSQLVRSDRMVRLATRLLELGVSMQVTRELLALDLDVVEKQLDWLPARRVRRKSSLIVSAIREDYEMPASLIEDDDSAE